MEANELAFFGKIAAGVTHELKNVLAIINESNGLMADLLAMAKESPMQYRDRFLRSVSKIDDQVRRGVDITSRFNRFAHSMDNPVVFIDLNEIVDQTIALAQRFARLKNIELKASPTPESVYVTTAPFRLQMALTRAIEACMAHMSVPGVIRMKVGESASGPGIDFSCETDEGENIELSEGLGAFRVWQEFEHTAGLLSAKIEWDSTTGGFLMLLPAGVPEQSKVAG